jgi:glucan phosphoethanolaminetransferase (alkaline phosphatase superfamily)
MFKGHKISSKYNVLASFFILIGVCSILILAIYAYILGSEQLLFHLYKLPNKLIGIIFENQSEYSFFIGISYLSIILFLREKYFFATSFFLLALVWVLLHPSLYYWFRAIGVDSFEELNNFDIQEAKFWLSTTSDIFKPSFSFNGLSTFIIKLILYSFIALSTIYIFNLSAKVFKLSSKSRKLFSYLVISVLLVFSLKASVYETIKLYYSNSSSFISTKENFTPFPINTNSDSLDITLVMYIGEATSIMNMELYGYSRKTTPYLRDIYEEDSNLLVFHNVFSTHTHTTQSLLEALSFGLKKEDSLMPISNRKRISLIDVLESSNVSSYLVSNQGSTGTWNRASKIIFNNSDVTYSTNTAILGNQDVMKQKPFDDVFFQKYFMNNALEDLSNKSLLALHSYAGHGEYKNFIPKSFHNPVDASFQSIDPRGVVGQNIKLLNSVESYDSTIKYIDYSVSEIIKKVKLNPNPTIFVYFADHGEDVYGGKGHESSRFSHEMVRIPFLIYFNKAARNQNEQLFKKYELLSASQELATLAQLSSTIIDLMGIEILHDQNNQVLVNNIIGEKTKLGPILVRETIDGITYIDLNQIKLNLKDIGDKKFIEKTNQALQIYLAGKSQQLDNTIFCYHRTNSIGKALRGRLLSECLEIDLFVDSNNNLSVNHPPQEDLGIRLNQIFEIAIENKLALWIDGKNLETKNNCAQLNNYFQDQKKIPKSILIELASKSHVNSNEIKSCVDDFKEMGFSVSYYVPTDIAIKCSKALSNGIDFEEIISCNDLYIDLELALSSGLFTDLSFDYEGIDAIESIEFAKSFHWNTWHVNVDNLHKIQPGRFNMLIISNDDPNNI